MTLLEKHYLLLKDLELERSSSPISEWWAARLDQKIVDMKQAINELKRSQTC